MLLFKTYFGLAGTALITIGLSSSASAHPHVFVEARSEVVLAAGAVVAIRHVWRFDQSFSLYAAEQLDVDRDGVLSNDELEALAKLNIESLAEYDFFTFLDSLPAAVEPPTEYGLSFQDEQLTLIFTLALSAPRPVGEAVSIEVYDPEFYVDFEYVDDDPVAISGDIAGCSAEFRGPAALDPLVQARIAEVPMDQVVPPDLLAAAVDLANTITVRCS
ncbi:MAG: DUF1007 family protein [Vicinamibacterales bacterium]